jgi:hypothetical protein
MLGVPFDVRMSAGAQVTSVPATLIGAGGGGMIGLQLFELSGTPVNITSHTPEPAYFGAVGIIILAAILRSRLSGHGLPRLG